MTWRTVVRSLVVASMLGVGAGTTAHAQSSADEHPWSFDFGAGWDSSISGNINSGGIGRINNQDVVILKNTYEDVYGTGLHVRFGGGYMLGETSEIRVTLSIQSLDADLVRMGDIGVSNLYGQYADYQSVGLDVGYRRYMPLKRTLKAYAEGTIGLAFVDETDVVLVAPRANLSGNATDFYDRTSAFALGANTGLLVQAASQLDLYVQLGLRYVTGMSEVDGLAGTGLETINDKSGRWTVPFIVGVRARF